MIDIYTFLTTNKIQFTRYDHPAVFTVEEGKHLNLNFPGAHTKNLFLRDKKGTRHILVVVRDDKIVDLDRLSSLLETSRLSFGSPDRLMRHLGVAPGSVTILGIVNDSNKSVEVFIDRDIWEAEFVQCHPLINTSTLVISKADLVKFLETTGHKTQVIDIPVRI